MDSDGESDDEKTRDAELNAGEERGDGAGPQDPGKTATAVDMLAAEPHGSEMPVALQRLLDFMHDTHGTARLRRDMEIGRGGMGRVQLAHDDALRRRTALKVLSSRAASNPSLVAAFLHEAQIMAQLDHPNIVPIHDVGVDAGGRLHFSMKLMRGRTFRRWIDKFPYHPYPPAELVQIIEAVTKICDALAFAHSHGVIHCDVTPRNIMIGDFGQTHLMDWGIARAGAVRAEHAQGDQPVTTTTEPAHPTRAMGTPAFMSPEHTGAGVLDERSDIFQIGGLLYFALCRVPPFANFAVETDLERIVEGRFEPPSAVAPWARVPPALERIVLKAMAALPDDRFQSVADLRAALTRFMWGGEAFEKRSVKAGEYIIREGSMGDCAYILASGEVQVYRTVRGEKIALRIMGEGEVFGEIAVLTRTRRSASVVALSDCELFVVDSESIELELEGVKPWMGALTRALATRLKEREDDYLESTMD